MHCTKYSQTWASRPDKAYLGRAGRYDTETRTDGHSRRKVAHLAPVHLELRRWSMAMWKRGTEAHRHAPEGTKQHVDMTSLTREPKPTYCVHPTGRHLV